MDKQILAALASNPDMPTELKVAMGATSDGTAIVSVEDRYCGRLRLDEKYSADQIGNIKTLLARAYFQGQSEVRDGMRKVLKLDPRS